MNFRISLRKEQEVRKRILFDVLAKNYKHSFYCLKKARDVLKEEMISLRSRLLDLGGEGEVIGNTSKSDSDLLRLLDSSFLLLQSLNSIVPMVFFVYQDGSVSLRGGWKKECGLDGTWKMQSPEGQYNGIETYVVYDEVVSNSTRDSEITESSTIPPAPQSSKGVNSVNDRTSVTQNCPLSGQPTHFFQQIFDLVQTGEGKEEYLNVCMSEVGALANSFQLSEHFTEYQDEDLGCYGYKELIQKERSSKSKEETKIGM